MPGQAVPAESATGQIPESFMPRDNTRQPCPRQAGTAGSRGSVGPSGIDVTGEAQLAGETGALVADDAADPDHRADDGQCYSMDNQAGR
jgi:hypothetical protein